MCHSQVCNGKKVIVVSDGTCPPNNFQLILEDNFENGFDSSLWLYTQPWGNHSVKGTSYSIEYFTNGKNYMFNDGKLKLVAREEKYYAKAVGYEDSAMALLDGRPNLRWWDYTSGMIYSKLAFGFGKFEFRAKIPKGKGLWSVCMLFGEANDEVDVFEFWNEHDMRGNFKAEKLATECHMTSHANERSCASHYTMDDFSKDFHTYTFIWNNNKMEWFIDGVLRRTSYKFYSILGQPVECTEVKAYNPYLFNRSYPMHDLHISLGLSLQAGENAPDEKTVFPAELEIDYVRYWRYTD